MLTVTLTHVCLTKPCVSMLVPLSDQRFEYLKLNISGLFKERLEFTVEIERNKPAAHKISTNIT